MRTKILTGFMILALVSFPAWGDEDQHAGNLRELTEQILEQQEVSSIIEIDPELVPDDLLVSLGDAVMAEMIPDERDHQAMDERLGGEGSAQLDAFHRELAFKYLQSGGVTETGWGPHMYGGSDMRGWYAPGMMAGWSPWSWLIGVLLIAVIIVVVVALVGRRNTGSRLSSHSEEEPLEIIKGRYAAGEISEEEYNRIYEILKDQKR